MSGIMQEITRFLTFVGVGVINTAIDLIVWKTLVFFFGKSEAIKKLLSKIKFTIYSFAHLLSYLVATLNSYFMNRFLTFADSVNTEDPYQVVKFFGVSFFSWILTTTFLQVTTGNKGVLEWVKGVDESLEKRVKTNHLFQKQWPTIAKLITILITMVTNYVGYKLFVF